MGAEIERFLSAIHAFAERVEGPDGEVRDITMMAHTLARIATGGMWFADTHLAGTCPTHRQGAGDATDGSEANLRDWLTRLVAEQRMLESFLITGLVWHIEERLEEFVEDVHTSPTRTRGRSRGPGARAADPRQVAAMANELSAARRPWGCWTIRRSPWRRCQCWSISCMGDTRNGPRLSTWSDSGRSSRRGVKLLCPASVGARLSRRRPFRLARGHAPDLPGDPRAPRRRRPCTVGGRAHRWDRPPCRSVPGSGAAPG